MNSLIMALFKFITSVFWHANGLLLIDSLPQDQTINGNYYAKLELTKKIHEKRPGLHKKKIIFYQDNFYSFNFSTSNFHLFL